MKATLENRGEKCILSIALFDADNTRIELKELEFEKRTSFASQIPSSSGISFYVPGEAPTHNGFEQHPTATHSFHMQKDEPGFKGLEIASSIRSKTKRKYLIIEKVGSVLSNPRFKELLHGEVVDGRIYFPESAN